MYDTTRGFRLEITSLADLATFVAMIRANPAEQEALVARLLADAGKIAAAAEHAGDVAAALRDIASDAPAAR
jgi:hypothetical protein